MKKLILIRHAKSSWSGGVTDHERPLEPRGINDATLVSQCFKSFLLIPDIVLSSSAKRAKETARIFLDNLQIDSNILQVDKSLYDFSGENLINTIKKVHNDVNTLMVFGHNDALTFFVNNFGDRYIENVSTSGLVVIEFHVESWKYIFKGETVKIIFPRDLRE